MRGEGWWLLKWPRSAEMSTTYLFSSENHLGLIRKLGCKVVPRHALFYVCIRSLDAVGHLCVLETHPEELRHDAVLPLEALLAVRFFAFRVRHRSERTVIMHAEPKLMDTISTLEFLLGPDGFQIDSQNQD